MATPICAAGFLSQNKYKINACYYGFKMVLLSEKLVSSFLHFVGQQLTLPICFCFERFAWACVFFLKMEICVCLHCLIFTCSVSPNVYAFNPSFLLCVWKVINSIILILNFFLWYVILVCFCISICVLVCASVLFISSICLSKFSNTMKFRQCRLSLCIVLCSEKYILYIQQQKKQGAMHIWK